MDWDKIISLLEHHGPWVIGTVAFATVSWRLGNSLLDFYKQRLELADARDERRIVAIENIVKTLDTIVLDNKAINANMEKTASLLLSSCKYKP